VAAPSHTRKTAAVAPQNGNRVSLPADYRSVARARRLVQAALHEAGLQELAVDVVLLTSEVCENAVLHAGTGFELEYTVSDDGVTVAVTDRGPAPLERRRVQPTTPGSRAATHGRGLLLVEQISSAWGTRHDGSGHQVWFTVSRAASEGPTAPAPEATADDSPWPDPDLSRWLLHLPSTRAGSIGTEAAVAELTRRLCDVLGTTGAEVRVDYGDGRGEVLLGGTGIAPDGPGVVTMHLPAPLQGRLLVRADGPTALELAELTAQRVAMCVEFDWLRGEAGRRRSWTTYLAETSELLAQSLDMRLTCAIVPQLVVPRLGLWCAVYLVDGRGRPAPAAATHADEAALPRLRADLAADGTELAGFVTGVRRGASAVAGINSPEPCIAAPLAAHGSGFGALLVGRPDGRPHSSEEVVLIADVARRAALAIDNARRNAEQVATSQALQEALLPRALPAGEGVEFAAAYLPVTRGADVGGDFYDVLKLADGHWIASIGDVCGKGARAAARAGQVRDGLRVLARAGHPLDRALGLLNDVLLDTGEPDQYCTVATTSVRAVPPAEAGEHCALDLELVLAGHLRPFLVRANGTGRFVGQVGTAAGLIEDFVVAPETLRLHAGDALVAFTDGVTERRHGREQFGDDRLAEALLAVAGGTATQLVDAVRDAVDRFSAAPQRDDLAVLVVKAPQTGG
jgi:phosphoserine phosphatase RsbU/P